MQIVIEIDENLYTRLFDTDKYIEDLYEACVAIRKGTPLPNGHGRLIDADDIDNHIVGSVDTRDCPTIIEADKAESKKV